MKSQNRSRLTKSQRNRIVLATLSAIEEISEKLGKCADQTLKMELQGELSKLRSNQRKLSVKSSDKTAVPLPKSYVQERQEKIAAASELSGRKRITAEFVQGGSPGTGKR